MTARAQHPTDLVLERRERLHARLLVDLPSIDPADIDAILTEAQVDRPRTIRELDRYLATNPAGLVTPDSRCPVGIVRLTQVLAGRGHAVTPPACVVCGRRRLLPHQSDAGRICERCYTAAHLVKCTSCGELGAPRARYGAELLCGRCHRRDPRSHKMCSGCGRTRHPEGRSPDGEPLCQRCAPRPTHICVNCGRQRPAHARTAAGPVCSVCYSKLQEHRPCGRCGQLGLIVIRAKDGQPEICQRCRTFEYDRSRRAARPPRPPKPDRPRRPDRSPKEHLPRPRTPRLAMCRLCSREREVTVTWPIGPICNSCYPAAQDRPAPCGRCGDVAVLIAEDADGNLICGPCGGSPFDYRCERCGMAGRTNNEGKCFRCRVENRLQQVLGGPTEQVPDHLIPLMEALVAAAKPRSVWVWLNKSAAAVLLAELAATGTPPTHADLDARPPSRSVHFVRRILMDTGVLPDRPDHLERIGPWLTMILADRPPEHTRLIQPYAQWHVLHRARRRAARGGDASTIGFALRSLIRAALALLTWIDSEGLTLATATQRHIDRWLTGGIGNERYRARDFIRWAASRRLVPPRTTIPAILPGQPKHYTSTTDYEAQLHRCLHDDNLAIDLRAAGALILLYGLHLTEILQLRRDQLQTVAGEDYLQLTSSALLLPPVLGRILRQLPRQRRNRTIVQCQGGPVLLFPGFNDHLPPNPRSFGGQLTKNGITPLAGRNTGRLLLAAEVPAAVLAEILGVHEATATRWAGRARRDWHTYLAHRRSEQE